MRAGHLDSPNIVAFGFVIHAIHLMSIATGFALRPSYMTSRISLSWRVPPECTTSFVRGGDERPDNPSSSIGRSRHL